jgi:AraC-like DNA-binding protein
VRDDGGMIEPEERTLLPCAALRPFVSEVHVMSLSPAPRRVLTRLPNGGASLVFCTRGGGEEVLAIGPTLRASYKASVEVPLCTRFSFRPGSARAFFGVALHELVGRVASVTDLWGPRAARLRGNIARAKGSVAGTIRAIEEALLDRLAEGSVAAARARLLARAVRAIESGVAEDAQIHALARRLGVSERQLRQVFHEEMGISPKRYARIARIRRAAARAGSLGGARLAAESGFYDQAHMSAEFRDLLGVTPRAFAAGDVPLGSGC